MGKYGSYEQSRSLNRRHCPRKRRGFSSTSFAITASPCPRRRISTAALGTASGSLWPQSQAQLSQSRSVAGGLEHIHRARRGAFGLRVKRDAGPEAGVQHHADGVLLDVVNDDAARAGSAAPLAAHPGSGASLSTCLRGAAYGPGSTGRAPPPVAHAPRGCAVRSACFCSGRFRRSRGRSRRSRNSGIIARTSSRQAEVLGFLRVDAEP